MASLLDGFSSEYYKNIFVRRDLLFSFLSVIFASESTIKTIYTTMEQNGNGQKQLQIELKEDVAQGVYSNLAMITHSSSEFVMDFISILPGMAKAQVKSRVIMSPEHAKRLMMALQDNVAKYENAFGTIEMKAQKGTYMPPISDFHGEA